jgi:hypothetical protein
MSAMGKDKLIYDPALVSESDNVGAYLKDGAGNALTSTTVGAKQALDVNVVNGPDDAIYAEDTASADGDDLMAVAVVREDTLAVSTSATGDYTWLKSNDVGALWVAPIGNVADDAADSGNPLKMGSRSSWGALTAISADDDRADLISDKYRRIYINDSPNIGVEQNTVSVDNTAAVALPTTALDGRRRMIIQNLGARQIFIGASDVATTDGLRIAAGATLTLEVGPDVAVYAISGSAVASDVRVFELA